MYKRIIEKRVRKALTDTPAVIVVGPRRAGKTTLVKKIATGKRPYFSMDDTTTFDLASSDPVGFIRKLDNAIIDEVQRVPELLLPIKRSIDENYRPGRFILTGSANILTLPRIADSLAGRIEILQMLPLAQIEISGRTDSFLNRIFDGKLVVGDTVVGDDLVRLVLTGGYPEVLTRSTERRRSDWARAYLKSVLTRDLRDIAVIERLSELPKFVRLLAQYSGNLINYSELGGHIGIDHKTCRRYTDLLEQVFLVSILSPWHINTIKRIIKAPKLHFLDSGILAASRGLTFSRLKDNRGQFGAILESFVFAEILRLMTASDLYLTPYHFRDQQMREVDIVLERDDGMVVGIEIKASATVTAKDFSGLKTLAQACKNKFAFGVVLYDSAHLIPFGDKLAAAPISCLWS